MPTQSAACLLIPLYGATPYRTLPGHSLWVVGKAAYVALVLVVTAELALTVRNWTRLLAAVCTLSAALPFPFLLLVWRVELASGYLDEGTAGAADLLFATPGFWLALVAVVGLTAGSRYLERAVRWLFFPDRFMRLELELMRREAAGAAAAAAGAGTGAGEEGAGGEVGKQGRREEAGERGRRG
ncbi:hypothetical protein CHLRE_07g316992v5 [Chlamydomonas reinhardtii]|uniref:P-type ATPase C-terminal domain-containing protein n=1 Tax=Chlamydomonas reinhardtii TaxID=3055 RepID=A0A2K3DIR5_CHLRE|nr:uncharacterized protein CHLRE_07g316992v5 [Chlamydomonas reinhardtii]PNW80420.1 hypothetical protein CHLRE_07g316992v5 [Chlamydomonas reinhardtii]